MRSLAFSLFSFVIMSAAYASPGDSLLRLAEVQKGPDVNVTGTNTSRNPVVAYVVVEESGHSRVVWKAVYTNGDSLKPGKTTVLGNVPKTSKADLKLVVDYVRLADGTTWGTASTDEAKEISVRFQK